MGNRTDGQQSGSTLPFYFFPDAYSLHSNNTEEDIVVLYLTFFEVCHFPVSDKYGIVFVNKQSFSGRWCCLETITNLHPNIRFIPRKNVSLVSIINPKYIYIINQDIQIYMLPIAGQTAEPIGLQFFVDTQGFPGSVYG